MNKFSLLSTTIFLSATFIAVADEPLQTIVVTDGRTDISNNNQSTNHVITSADIERSSAQDLPQLLSNIPGVSIENNGGLGANASVRIRGTESDHVLVLINGVRTASATTGTTAIQFIPLEQIERIEVVKGPKSGLYGSEAIGGVIQIFTKTGESEDSSYLNMSYGANSTRSIASGFHASEGQSHFGVNTRYVETNGIDRTLNNTGVDQDHDNYQQQDVLISYGRWFTNGTQFQLNYNLNEGRTDFDASSENDHTDFEQSLADLSIDIPLSFAALNIDLSYFNSEDVTSGSNPAVFETTRNSLTTFLHVPISTSSQFILGADYYDDRVNSAREFSVTERDNVAAFGEYAMNTNVYYIQLALRRDNNEEYGKQNSGNVLFGAKISKDQSINISYGEAFKAPTFNDLYFPFTDFGGGFTFEGNPDLKPEESKTTELSYQIKKKSWNANVSFYKTRIKNLIASRGSTLENVNEADINGVELLIGTKVLGWDLDGYISKVEAENSDTDERLIRRPKTTASLTASQKIDKLYFSASARGETSRRQSQGFTGGFGLFDILTAYDLTKQSTLKLEIRNVFDKEYVLIDGFNTFRTERRAAEVTYRYHFK